MGETSKAKNRRLKENFFIKYCNGKGIDIGCWDDPLTPSVDKYDNIINKSNDAETMLDINDDTYDFVYSSHCLEDIERPSIAIRNWYRILKPGGFLIIYVPHRDLFEKRKTLPSAGNSKHQHYFLLDRNEIPATIGLIPLIVENLYNYDLIYIKKCDENYNYEFIKKGDPFPDGIQVIANGEFSIECVLQKYPKIEFVEDYIKK